ncbi:MAG: hypothetical protein ACTHOL_19550, partial [Luteibacter jiangsuensis]
MIEHPWPTDATAKRLYALVVSCAFPECSEPLYREDETSGSWVLNSRIAHICARSEGGPRWDETQTADENRSDSNLILMCIRHAAAIDEPSGQGAYTPDLLRQWKAAQIEAHRRRRQGWPLTGAMARAALAASFQDVGIAINHSTLNLGGEGGRAPGAGGGGGGAVGPGSRGGNGGNGGTVTDLIGDPLGSTNLVRFLSDALAMSSPPGSGGAGAGAVGPGSIGGDGGSGGDGFRGSFAVEPGDQIQFEIGKAGQAARLPGQHGEGGGDTSLTIRSSDGTIKETFRAKGGAGALSGRLPDDWLPISQADVDGGFHVSALITANAFELREGLLFALGAGWTVFPVATLPTETVWPVACVATWNSLPGSHCRGLQLCVVNPDGQEVSRLVLQLPAPHDQGR